MKSVSFLQGHLARECSLKSIAVAPRVPTFSTGRVYGVAKECWAGCALRKGAIGSMPSYAIRYGAKDDDFGCHQISYPKGI